MMAAVEFALTLAFWGSLLAVAYAYLLYPLGVFVLKQFASRERAEWETLPTVTLIIAAYNEEEIIGEKVENSLELDYPEEKLDIVVFSDASSDATDEIVQSYDDDRGRLMRIEGRVGKTECQNRVVESVDSDIVAFSDANSMYEPDAIEALVSRFTDDTGCVVGELHFPETGTNISGFSLYRAYERFIQRSEGAVGSVVKGNGAIYAVRRSCYVPLPRDSISDFAELLAIRAAGWRIGFAPDAVAKERARETVDSELRAKKRITTRSWHSLWRFTRLLNPFSYGFYSVQLWSRTILLWLSPIFLLVALFTGLPLLYIDQGLAYAVVVAGATVYFLCLLVAVAFDRRGIAAPLLCQAAYYFALLNVSLLVGLWNFLQNENIVVWETDDRAS